MPPTADRGWVCLGCQRHNLEAADACSACGWSFAAALAPESPPRRLPSWIGPALRELVLVNALFIVWRVVGHYSVFHQAGAFARGRWIWHVERVLHLPSEATLQRWVINDHGLIHAANLFYEYAHAPSLVLFLGWMFWRHRDRYRYWRNIVVVFTGASLLIEVMPVAPPRLIPGLGLVDTARVYHESVYTSLGKGISDQLSAMPSVHIGWALLIAAGVIAVSRSRWRWLILIHVLVTAAVVIVTANHYWLDGVGAGLLLGAICLASSAYASRRTPSGLLSRPRSRRRAARSVTRSCTPL
jgi:hypothetical protein